jgi:hypothetical protein
MHAASVQQLTAIKMSERLQEAERERRARAAVSMQQRPHDAVTFGDRLRRNLLRLRLGFGLRGSSADAVA